LENNDLIIKILTVTYWTVLPFVKKDILKTRVAEPELEPEPPESAFFGSSGAGAVNLPRLRSRLRTKLKNNFLNGRKYVKVSKKYAESADM